MTGALFRVQWNFGVILCSDNFLMKMILESLISNIYLELFQFKDQRYHELFHRCIQV